MKITHTEDYVKLRGTAYPAIGDQLDDIWKILDALSATVPAVAKAMTDSPIFQRVKQVKTKYPKPVDK